MPLFSVIVPVYNAERSIERCVESICKSGGDEVEVVLVDDGSNDASYVKCLGLAETYTQVKVFQNEKNSGVSRTRNRAIEKAIGEYLLFVDSDDYVSEDYIPVFTEAVKTGKTFAVCGYYNHDERQSGRCDTVIWDDCEMTQTYALKGIIEQLQKKTLLQQLWNKVFVTAKVKEKNIRFDESINIGEDTRFILDYIQQNYIAEITCIPKPLYHYMRDNNGSLMYKVGYESVEEPLKNLRKMYEIMGLGVDEINEKIETARAKQIELYAYLIMHNVGMKRREKKRLIFTLHPTQGKELYRKNKSLYRKERIMIWLKKLGLKR